MRGGRRHSAREFMRCGSALTDCRSLPRFHSIEERSRFAFACCCPVLPPHALPCTSGLLSMLFVASSCRLVGLSPACELVWRAHVVLRVPLCEHSLLCDPLRPTPLAHPFDHHAPPHFPAPAATTPRAPPQSQGYLCPDANPLTHAFFDKKSVAEAFHSGSGVFYLFLPSASLREGSTGLVITIECRSRRRLRQDRRSIRG